MASNHPILSHAPRDRHWKPALHDALNWAMVLVVVLAASAGFTLDHLLPIVP